MNPPNQKDVDARNRKRTFKLKVHAEVYALQAMNAPSHYTRRAEFCKPYRCPVCGHWHLTSQH